MGTYHTPGIHEMEEYENWHEFCVVNVNISIAVPQQEIE